MNEYEIVVNHIQEVTAIAKRFDIADKPEVLEYLTLVQLHAVKRDRTRVIDNKMKEVNDELERLEGEMEILDEVKNIESEKKDEKEFEKAPEETLGEDVDYKDVAFLDKVIKQGEELLSKFKKADPENGEGARSRLEAAIEITKLMKDIEDEYYTEKEGEINERTKEKAEETFGRLSALKMQMLG
jgi:hypothetical protein